MPRVYNFSAGPAILPEAVLKQAQEELLDWHGAGASIMEMSHRGKEFVSVASEAEQDVRDLLGVPNNYKVLFLQGGASTQFADDSHESLAWENCCRLYFNWCLGEKGH